MPFFKKSNQLLARVNFPLYTVQSLTERHILVAGGGGGAKTGIRNVIEIYELSNDGNGCRAKSVTHYETGSQAIMNCAVYECAKYFILFAGMDGLCQLYKMKLNVQENRYLRNGFIKETATDSSSSLRNRKLSKHDVNSLHSEGHSKAEESSPLGEADVDLVFDVKQLDSFQTDFSDDPFQKLARFSSKLKVLATAGSDGHIRMWKYPEMRKMYEIHAHKDDVDDLDFSPLGDKIVSVSRDGHGKIWNSKNGDLVCDLQYEIPDKSQTKYIYRSCRFSAVEGDETKPALFITLNPAVRTKPPSPSFLSKWDGTTHVVQKMVHTGCEMLSAMAVSDDGRFIGLGTQEGSVSIYIAFSLQLLYRCEHVHSIFVTGLEFLRSCDATRHLTGGQETSLISISVDNHINIHYVPNRTTIGIFTLVIMFSVTLFLVFLLMDYFSL